MDKHALPEEEFERYLDRLYDRELRKYEETWEEVTLPEDLYEEDLRRREVDDEPEDYFGSGLWREELRLEELKELDPDAAIRAEREAREEALMRAKATIKVYNTLGYPAPSDHGSTDW